MVRNTPRSLFASNGFPIAATWMRDGFVGWMRTVAIWPVSRNPLNRQGLPASVDLKTPAPDGHIAPDLRGTGTCVHHARIKQGNVDGALNAFFVRFFVPLRTE